MRASKAWREVMEQWEAKRSGKKKAGLYKWNSGVQLDLLGSPRFWREGETSSRKPYQIQLNAKI